MIHGVSPVNNLVQRLIQNTGPNEGSSKRQEQSISKYESLDKVSISSAAKQAASVQGSHKEESGANLNAYLLTPEGRPRAR